MALSFSRMHRCMGNCLNLGSGRQAEEFSFSEVTVSSYFSASITGKPLENLNLVSEVSISPKFST